MSYKVKEVADIAGISVRMLHHYDKIGLLKPKFYSSAGYRLYSNSDLERLQQILFFRELDFSLQEIKDILDNPTFDKKQALVAQKELLEKKRQRLEKIIKNVERTLNTIEGGIVMNDNMFDGFDMSEIEKYKKEFADEVKQKYGNSDAYKESEKKTLQYTKDDWERISKTYESFYTKLGFLINNDPNNYEVQKLIEEYRQFITDNFYNCTPEIFRWLGDMYVEDERFTKNIDKYQEGLSEFLKKAINIYCDNLEE